MRNKQDLLFLVIGISLFSILIIAGFYSFSFLALKINTALNTETENNNQLVRINFESLKNIQIANEAKNAININNATTTNNVIE